MERGNEWIEIYLKKETKIRKRVKKYAYFMLINVPPPPYTHTTDKSASNNPHPLASRTECREAAWSSAGDLKCICINFR